MALFLLKMETYDAKNSWEFFEDYIICLVKIGQIQSKFDKQKFFLFAPHSTKSCSSCIANCIPHMFLITQFLANEALGKNTLAEEIVRRKFSSIRVSTFTTLTSYLCSKFYGHDWLQTCRYKTRELWGLFAEVREKSVLGLRDYWHFFVKMRF